MAFPSTHQRLTALSKYAARAGGAGILVIAVMISVYVFIRKFVSSNQLPDPSEIAGYIFAIAITFSFPFVYLQRANIRIDTLYVLFPKSVRSILDIVGAVLFLIVTALLTYGALDVLWSSWDSNSISVSVLSVPLWIPQLFWVCGMIMFLGITAFVTLYAIIALLRGQLEIVDQIVGLPSLGEEIEEFSAKDGEPTRTGERI